MPMVIEVILGQGCFFDDSKIDLWNIFTSILKSISLYITLAIRELESLNKISTQILPCAFGTCHTVFYLD